MKKLNKIFKKDKSKDIERMKNNKMNNKNQIMEKESQTREN